MTVFAIAINGFYINVTIKRWWRRFFFGFLMSRKKSVFLTGGSGFIAKHIIRQLLDAGYHVRASVRNGEKADQVVAAVSPHIKETVEIDKMLSFAVLDLTQDTGWTDALKGMGTLIHTASPFPMIQPENPEDLIRPAVDGTTRALAAALAAGVERVIMTSSIVAIAHKRLPAGRFRYIESDWTELNSPLTTAYAISKTKAEKTAWSFVREHPEIKLTTINPGLVLGPPLDVHIGTSLRVIQRVLSGKDPMVPRLGFPIVDVRDVATMHVRALQTPESIGARFIACERFMWMQDLALILKAEYPDRRIPTRVAPDWIIKLLAKFDRSLRSVVPHLGIEQHFDNTAASEVLGMEFIEARQAIKTSAASLIRDRLIV